MQLGSIHGLSRFDPAVGKFFLSLFSTARFYPSLSSKEQQEHMVEKLGLT
jgi:hypothetical protein